MLRLTLQNMNSKNVTMFTHTHGDTPYTRAFFQTINMQDVVKRAVSSQGGTPRRNASLAFRGWNASLAFRGFPPRATPEVPVWRSAFPKNAGMAFRCVPAQFKHWLSGSRAASLLLNWLIDWSRHWRFTATKSYWPTCIRFRRHGPQLVQRAEHIQTGNWTTDAYGTVGRR